MHPPSHVHSQAAGEPLRACSSLRGWPQRHLDKLCQSEMRPCRRAARVNTLLLHRSRRTCWCVLRQPEVLSGLRFGEILDLDRLSGGIRALAAGCVPPVGVANLGAGVHAL